MTWRDVARRDLRSTYRSRAVAVVGGLLLLATVGVVSVLAALGPDDGPRVVVAVLAVGSALSFAVPAVALVGTYAALVGERTTGSIRFLVGLPNSRTDAFVGKYVGRSAVVLGSLAAGTVLAALVVATTFADGGAVGMLLVGAAAVPLALAFVGLGLTASAVTSTDNRAVALAIGVFVLFRPGWNLVQWFGLQAAETPYPRPAWYFWFGRLNPLNAYVRATAEVGDVGRHPLLTRPGPEVPSLAASAEFAVVVLLAWAALAPVGGLLYWRRRDLL